MHSDDSHYSSVNVTTNLTGFMAKAEPHRLHATLLIELEGDGNDLCSDVVIFPNSLEVVVLIVYD